MLRHHFFGAKGRITTVLQLLSISKALNIRNPVPIQEINVIATDQTQIPVNTIQAGFQKFFIEAGIIPNLPSITLALRQRNAKFNQNK